MDTGYPDQLVVAPPPTLKPSRPNHLKLGSPQRKANLQEGRTLRTSSIDNLSERLSERSSRSVSIPEAPLDSECDSSEVEKSDLESESDEESTIGCEDWQEEDGFATLDLHPVHSTPVKQFVSFPGCKNVSQMATAAAADTNIGVRQHRLIRTRLSTGAGELFFSCQGASQVVPLLNSEVSSASCTGPMAKGMSVVAIALPPSATAMTQRPSSAASSPSRRPSLKGMIFGRVPSDKKDVPAVSGWVFYCQTLDLSAVLQALGEAGCTRSDLFRFYKASAGKIGSGSFGAVVHATAISTGDMAAIKELKDGSKTETVQAEVNMLVRAQGHDKIVKFRGCFCEPEKPYLKWFLVFDVHPYGDLYDRVASCTRMTEKDAMPLVRDLCEALKHLHERQIFHRDVKPENLLMANGRQKGVVLTDFGISTLVTNEAEMKKPLGTIGYASPEMLKGEATSWEGDAFGTGIVLYFMLSKSTPFLAPTTKLMAELTEGCKVNMKYSCFEHLSEDCRNMILDFLKKDVQERLSVEKALMSRIIRKTYVTSTEPALVRVKTQEFPMRRSASKQAAEKRQETYAQEAVKKPQHHLIALTAGELPELTRLHK